MTWHKSLLRKNQDEWKNLKYLEIPHDIKRVSEDLQQLHRDNTNPGVFLATSV